MNLPSAVLFAVIALAFAYTFSRLVKKVYGAVKNASGDAGNTGCSCCSGKCSHCTGCGKMKL